MDRRLTTIVAIGLMNWFLAAYHVIEYLTDAYENTDIIAFCTGSAVMGLIEFLAGFVLLLPYLGLARGLIGPSYYTFAMLVVAELLDLFIIIPVFVATDTFRAPHLVETACWAVTRGLYWVLQRPSTPRPLRGQGLVTPQVSKGARELVTI